MNILVTGGLGFIGSHTVVELIKNNHTVIVVDNLVNSKVEVIEKIMSITGVKPVFYPIDVTNEKDVEKIFKNHQVEGVLHLAGLKSVGESIEKPLEYYFNNVVSTIVLSRTGMKYGVEKFVFSSSAAVYGEQNLPLMEEMELKKSENPYAETKLMSERLLTDIANVNKDFSVSLLRYFNPVGAHRSGLIGEQPKGSPNNLMPLIVKVAKGESEKIYIYGDDYDTIDGTGVRDYIHVVDLAKGHVVAIEGENKGAQIYNLGTGKGTSVLELINTFMKVNNIKIPYEIVGRRAGDIASSFADPSRAEQELGWKAELSIEDMVRDAWNYEQKRKLISNA